MIFSRLIWFNAALLNQLTDPGDIGVNVGRKLRGRAAEDFNSAI